MSDCRLYFKKLREKAAVPKRATPLSAGLDLCACLDEDITVNPGERRSIPTGLAVEYVGEKRAALLIYARSSLAVKFGITLPNCVGVVDEDYRGEIIVPLINHGDKPYTISDGDRIAQLVITPIETPEVFESDALSDTARGEGGFGSTGR